MEVGESARYGSQALDAGELAVLAGCRYYTHGWLLAELRRSVGKRLWALQPSSLVVLRFLATLFSEIS